jgi:carboxyl-terminal processing protease
LVYLRLYAFYQDQDSSSSGDLAKEIEKYKKEHRVKGVILDLRYNSGGLLNQAVGVVGLFITKGTVTSIKDDTGHIQHMRALEGKTEWLGPLIVLVNRGSASASEIVAGTLQDYGRAIIVGDDHTYGKGSFQTFTLNTTKNGPVNPQGEYKVTRGRYYTVSGKTPQLTGVSSDIVVPGALSETEVGEKYAKFPLENDTIKENFDDDLLDVPFFQREKVKALYKFDLQKKMTSYQPYLESLKKNSADRISQNKNYQNFLKEIQKKDKAASTEEESSDQFGQSDLQLIEAYNILKDLIYSEQMSGSATKESMTTGTGQKSQ